MMTMSLPGFARTSFKHSVRSWVADEFQDHFHLMRLFRHRAIAFSFHNTTFRFVKCDKKIVNIIFHEERLSPLIRFLFLDKLLLAVLQLSSLLAVIFSQRAKVNSSAHQPSQMAVACGRIPPVTSPRAAWKRSKENWSHLPALSVPGVGLSLFQVSTTRGSAVAPEAPQGFWHPPV